MPDDKASTSTTSGVVHITPPNLPLPPKLEVRGNLGANWKKFKRLWTNYEVASRLKTQDKEIRLATLMTCLGPDVLDIYDGLPFASENDKDDIDKVIELLESYCVGDTNETYERYVFNKRDQTQGESFDTYLTSLRTLAKTCNFGNLRDDLIRDRLVLGLLDNTTRKKLLAEPKLTLDKCINICRANESTTKRFKDITSDEINAVQTSRRPTKSTGNPQRNAAVPRNKGNAQGQSASKAPLIKCKFCLKSHPRKKELCAAWGKTCKECGVKNHFTGSTVCKHKPAVHELDEQSESSDDDYFFYVETVGAIDANDCPRKIFAPMQIGNKHVKFQLDCGATVNILPVDEYIAVANDPALKKLNSANKSLQMFNKTTLKTLGIFSAKTVNPKNDEAITIEFVVVKEGHTPILGAQAVQQFQLITVNTDNIMSIENRSIHSDIISEFNDVFEGDGKIEGMLHLQVDNTVTPTVLPVRTVAHSVKEDLKAELNRLEKKGIIVPVDVPTDWVSSMVVQRKRNGKIRLCIDPKPLNKALKRNHYPLPVLDDLLAKLTNAKVFSVVDAKNGYWHVQLDEDSSLLTTFGTPWGRYRWTRMPFGISPAPEEFQRRLDNAFQGLDGVMPIFDDTLVYGNGDTEKEALEDHDRKLTALLQRCREKGVKLNREKLKLRRKEVDFMGHIISSEGLKVDPAKVQGINEIPSPTCKQDVKRLIGMLNYLQRFATNLSQLTAPLRDLLKENVHFRWDDAHEQSLTKIKKVISESPVLKFFDPKGSVEIQCDASDRGLGACLMQDGQPVAYASRSMTETESHYAQIEKEMLAIVFAVERFEQCVYGRQVKVETDHKPLESIFKKSLISAPKRLQRMLLRLQKFDLDVTYKKGTDMVLADTLSRAYKVRSEGELKSSKLLRGETERDTEVINMAQHLPVSEDTQSNIRKATEADPTLQELKTAIRRGWPSGKSEVPVCIQDYFPFRDELTLQNGLIFKGERLVVPSALRDNMLMKIHASHIGIQGCLRRAREVLYWPGMNREVEDYIARCETCNNYHPQQGKEPMICHQIASRPWEKVAMDLFQLDNKDFLVTVDYYSNYFEVDKLSSKTAKEVIGKVKAHFARHGIPDQVISDNGPPFLSAEFQEFAQAYSFEHVTSSPMYPQSNGKAENAVNTAQRLMRKAMETRSDPYLALLDWRNTPSESINSSPAQRIFGRRTKTLLPTSTKLLQPRIPGEIDLKLKQQKARQSYYYNRGAKELQELYPGDMVRIEPPKKLGNRKTSTKAEVQRQVDIRSYEVRTEDGRVFRRNRRHLRQTKELTKPEFGQPHLPPPELQPTNSTESQTPTMMTQESSPTKPDKVTVKPPGESVVVTRSGRVVKPPVRFQ